MREMHPKMVAKQFKAKAPEMAAPKVAPVKPVSAAPSAPAAPEWNPEAGQTMGKPGHMNY